MNKIKSGSVPHCINILCRFLGCLLLSGLSAFLFAQTPAEIEAKFGDFSLQTDSLNMSARLFVPENYDDTIAYPLIMVLHGGGGFGTDNEHIGENPLLFVSWGTDSVQSENPCFIFAPQSFAKNARDSSWTQTDVHQCMMLLLDSIITTYSIDTNRLYLTGYSMGAMGTWQHLSIDPGKYAAGLILANASLWPSDGERDSALVRKIRHIPVWSFHGVIDWMVPIDFTRGILEQYPKFGLTPLYTHYNYRYSFSFPDSIIESYIDNHVDLIYSEMQGVGHGIHEIACNMTLPKKWLFQQRKRMPDAISVSKTENYIAVSGDYEISITASELIDSISIWGGHMYSADWKYIESIDTSVEDYIFDSHMMDDHPFCQLKFLAHDSAGYVIGKDYSDIMRIDNEGNGPPFISLTENYIYKYPYYPNAEHTLTVFVADPESDTLHVYFSVSYDNGKTFEPYSDTIVEEGLFDQIIDFTRLYCSDNTVLRAEVTDGEHTATAQTLYFKQERYCIVSVESVSPTSLEFFPNPATDFLKIRTEKPECLSIEITSIKGQLVYNGILDGPTYQIDLSSYEKGLYFITIRSRDYVRTEKIIKL